MCLCNYGQGVVAAMSAVREFMGLSMYHSSDEMVLQWLKENQFKQVIVMLIDGMGAHQIQQHCDATDFLKTHCAKIIDTVYPPTTVAATTSILTGKQPCETGWLGWQQYFSDIDQNLQMFLNQDYYTMDQRKDRYTYQALPIKTMIEEAEEKGIPAKELFPYWKDDGAKSFEELCHQVVKESQSQDKKLIYAYWDGYDSFMHKHGESAKESADMLRGFDEILANTMSWLSKDSGLMILADHGHIDVRCKYLVDYPDLIECFSHMPGLEPRTIAFYIKDGKKEIFKNLFIRYFQNDFKLFTKDEIIDRKLFGDGELHPAFTSFLGDFVACATFDLVLDWNPLYEVKGAHAGMTKEEMKIPLILYKAGN